MTEFEIDQFTADIAELIESSNKTMLNKILKVFNEYDRRVGAWESFQMLIENGQDMFGGEVIQLRNNENDKFSHDSDRETSTAVLFFSFRLNSLMKDKETIYTTTKACQIPASRLNMYLNCELSPTIRDMVVLSAYLKVDISYLLGTDLYHIVFSSCDKNDIEELSPETSGHE